MQGMAEKIDPAQVGSPAFSQALLKVLTQESYSQAAKALSAKIKAHKRTPVQQAGGMGSSHHGVSMAQICHDSFHQFLLCHGQSGLFLHAATLSASYHCSQVTHAEAVDRLHQLLGPAAYGVHCRLAADLTGTRMPCLRRVVTEFHT